MRGLNCAVEIVSQRSVVPHHVVADVKHFLQSFMLQGFCSIQHPAQQLDAFPGGFGCIDDRDLVFGVGGPEPQRKRDPVPRARALAPLADGHHGLDDAGLMGHTEAGVVNRIGGAVLVDEPGERGGDAPAAVALR